jgi:histidinol phosphatase-like enzyme (inositol monophosphatase family)
MGPETDDSLLEAAAEVARLAGAVALERFRQTIAIEWKADGSPVTAADRAAERVAREWIARRFPHDGLLGEEFGEQEGTSGRRWLLDPIDGTRSFVRGVPLWGTLVAVVWGDEVLAGAASFPAVDEHLAAGVGRGCWHNGVRASVSRVDRVSEALVLTTDPLGFDPARRDGWARLVAQAGAVRTWGDCYGYLLLATGRADVMIDPRMHAWDSACLWPIVLEAGGRLTDWSGRPTPFGGSTVATNASLAERVRALLGGTS